MYIALDGMFGTTCCGGVRGVDDDPEATVEAFLGAFCASAATLVTASGFAVASGGGNGEIEIPVTDAV
jgi:hypothetical protein